MALGRGEKGNKFHDSLIWISSPNATKFLRKTMFNFTCSHSCHDDYFCEETRKKFQLETLINVSLFLLIGAVSP